MPGPYILPHENEAERHCTKCWVHELVPCTWEHHVMKGLLSADVKSAQKASIGPKRDEIIGRSILDMVRISPGTVSCCEVSTVLALVDWQPKPMANLNLSPVPGSTKLEWHYLRQYRPRLIKW